MIAGLLLLVFAAQATTPGGWRIQAALPETSAAVRPVLLPTDPLAPIAQVTADLRVKYGPVSADLQLPWVHTWDRQGHWAHSYPGQARLGLYAWQFHEHFQLGIETDFPVQQGGVTHGSWGTHANEVLPSNSLASSFHTTWATENFSVTARLALGLRWGPYVLDLLALGDTPTSPLVEGGWAITRHIAGPVGFVGELEVITDQYVPMSTRLMLRADLPARRGSLALDLGLQHPLLWSRMGMDEHLLTFQPCAQIRWWPVLDWPWPGVHPGG
jgi:hypothetical protein